MLRFSPWVIASWLVASGAAVWYTANNVSINTDTADMIAAELPFRRSYEHYRQTFPDQVDSLIAVVDAGTPEQAESAALALAAGLKAQPGLFVHADVPGSGDFYARNAILYLSQSELEALAERLIAAAPLLGRLSGDPSLRSLTETLRRLLDQPAADTALDATPVLRAFSDAIRAELTTEPFSVSWQTLIAGGAGPLAGSTRRFVLIKPILNWNELFAAEPPIAAVRKLAETLQLTPETGVRVRITGDAALGYEELTSALSGSQRSVMLALVVVGIILAWGLRSAWMTGASLVTLLVGLSLTGAFATWAVGELNLLSFAAAVLYIGLGVDYAIHFCLRYRETLGLGEGRRDALRNATGHVRGPLLLCALTTATGFFAFLPTEFSGVAQLGLICGTGMFINLAVTLTLLPALLVLLPVPARARRVSADETPRYELFPLRHARPIRIIGVVLGLGALLALPWVRFDRNPLNLRDVTSESVATLRDLRGDPTQPMMNITVLAGDEATARAQAAALRALPTVREVITPQDLQPQSTPDKLALIEELSILLGPALADIGPPATPPDAGGRLEALQALRQSLSTHAASGGATDRAAAAALLGDLTEFLDRLPHTADHGASALDSLEKRLLGTLPVNLRRLRSALTPDSSPPTGLPDDVARRWISPDGVQRIAVYPREDIDDNAALRRFVESVQAVAPDATDEPVLNLRAGDSIVRAFQQALATSGLVILALLLFLLRSITAAALVLTPLVLAGLLTAATLGLAGVPFNFANVVALPLLLGANVDNGIHMVHRYRHGGGDILRTSTSRAIVFSGLTNMCGFANLLASSHPGTASMGLVLTLGMAWTLLTTLLVVPALLTAGGRGGR